MSCTTLTGTFLFEHVEADLKYDSNSTLLIERRLKCSWCSGTSVYILSKVCLHWHWKEVHNCHVLVTHLLHHAVGGKRVSINILSNSFVHPTFSKGNKKSFEQSVAVRGFFKTTKTTKL